MKSSILTILISAFLFIGCSNSKYEYWEMSQFNIQPNALENDEEIKLIYSSRGPDNNKALEYYLHLIVVSQNSGDTVNILTTVDNGFTADDAENTYNYFDENSPAAKILQMDFEELVENGNISERIKNHKTKHITKVARDPEFDNIANNNFPTVIGVIGTSKD